MLRTLLLALAAAASAKHHGEDIANWVRNTHVGERNAVVGNVLVNTSNADGEGCQWDSATCAAAAKYGRLEVLNASHAAWEFVRVERGAEQPPPSPTRAPEVLDRTFFQRLP